MAVKPFSLTCLPLTTALNFYFNLPESQLMHAASTTSPFLSSKQKNTDSGFRVHFSATIFL
jgi:hypothetical protein